MGGFMQPQGHVQVVTNTIDFLMNPQEALDAPRWQWVGEKKIHVERGFPYGVTEELVRRGHEISVLAESGTFGRGQMVKEFDEAVFTAETGKLLGPVKTSFGYHLIQVDELTGEEVSAYEEVAPQIAQQLTAEKQNKRYMEVRQELIEKYGLEFK